MIKRLRALFGGSSQRPPQFPPPEEEPGSPPPIIIEPDSREIEAGARPAQTVSEGSTESPGEVAPARLSAATVDVTQGDTGEVNVTVVHATVGEPAGGPSATVTQVAVHPISGPTEPGSEAPPTGRKAGRRRPASRPAPVEIQPLLRRTPASEHAFRSIYRNPSRYRDLLVALYLAGPEERGPWVATWFRDHFSAAWESARRQYQPLRESGRLPRSLDTEAEFLEVVAELWAAQLWDWADTLAQASLPFRQAVEHSQGLTG